MMAVAQTAILRQAGVYIPAYGEANVRSSLTADLRPPSAIFPKNLTRLTNRRVLNTSVKDQLTLFSAVNFDSP